MRARRTFPIYQAIFWNSLLVKSSNTRVACGSRNMRAVFAKNYVIFMQLAG